MGQDYKQMQTDQTCRLSFGRSMSSDMVRNVPDPRQGGAPTKK